MADVPLWSSALPPSTSTKTQQRQRRQLQRQLQKRWVQLVDSWNQLTHSQRASDDLAVSSLLEEISQVAQQICRSVTDKQWLVSAFQMAVSAVLLDSTLDKQVPSLLVQLGQQLLQLAIHSVTKPLLDQLAPNFDFSATTNNLKEGSKAHPEAAQVLRALKEFEHLSQRLSDFELLAKSGDSLESDSQLLLVCLHEHASTLLLSLSQLPGTASLIGALLQQDSQLLAQVHPYRLTLLSSLLRAGQTAPAVLHEQDLLVGWSNGVETGLWSTATNAKTDAALLQDLASLKSPLPALVPAASVSTPQTSQSIGVDELLDFYLGQFVSLERDFALPDVAHELCKQVVQHIQIQEPNERYAKLKRAESELAVLCKLVTSKRSAEIDMEAFQTMQPRDVAATLIRSANGSDETAAESTLESIRAYKDSLNASSLSVEDSILSLVDDKNPDRILAANMVKQLGIPSNADAFQIDQDRLLSLLAGISYARGPSKGDRFSAASKHRDLVSLRDAVAELTHGLGQSSSLTAPFLPAVQRAISEDKDSQISARQVVSQLAAGKTSASASAYQLIQHLGWLEQLQKMTITGSEARSSETSELQALDMCWMLAFGGPDGSNAEQKNELKILIKFFIKRNPISTSKDRGLDVAGMRRKANWGSFLQNLDSLVGQNGVFAALEKPDAVEIVLACLLKEEDLDLFRSLAMDSSVMSNLSDERLERLVLSVSIELYDEASVASTSRPGPMKTASDILSTIPPSTAIKQQQSFIKATCRLCTFRLRLGTKLMEPKDIRATPDKMDLIANLLASKEDAYKSPELILEMANKLCAEEGMTASQKTMIEARTLAMLADAATAAGDFDEAAGFCTRLVEKIDILRKRGAPVLEEAQELGWKTCLQLSKHPDAPQRLTLLSQVLSLCPAERISSTLKAWNKLDAVEEPLAQTKASAASMLPLSFSPLSYFGGGTKQAEGGFGGRAAQLFHFEGEKGRGGYLANLAGSSDVAARAARNFLGGWTSESEQQASGFSLSRGVGWLIGDDRKS